jgi:hypothetical protein
MAEAISGVEYEYDMGEGNKCFPNHNSIMHLTKAFLFISMWKMKEYPYDRGNKKA